MIVSDKPQHSGVLQHIQGDTMERRLRASIASRKKAWRTPNQATALDAAIALWFHAESQ